MNWECKRFHELTTQELYWLLRARSAIFVVEQSHLHLDLDGKDEDALHIYAFDATLQPMPVIAYARVRCDEDDDDPEVTVDKLFTNPNRRGDGTAEQLVGRAQRTIAAHWPGQPVRVSVPVYLKSFYEDFGFKKVEGPYLDHGMPYIGMRWRAPAADTLYRMPRDLPLPAFNVFNLR